jgi:tripartite-type tricarboxylate transporter receptor subunit TctC
MPLLRLFRITLIAAAALALPLAHAADPWPTKPVKIVIPFSAGGVQDALARSLSNELSAALGQPIIVENHPGAGGTLATSLVAKSPADGYTLILAAASHTINGSLYTRLNYDPIKDFTGAAYIGDSGYVLVVNSEVPAKTVAEFIAYAKSRPGQLNYATAGAGSATHLSMAYFVGMAGLDIVNVPTKGTGDAMIEVLSGRSQALIAANIGALPFAKDARVRFLGVTSEKPSPFVPGVPPIGNTLKGYSFDSWFGLLAPAATPAEAVNRLNSEVAKLIRQPEVIERLHKQGIEPGSLSVAEFNKLLKEDYERMAKVVKISGAKAD